MLFIRLFVEQILITRCTFVVYGTVICRIRGLSAIRLPLFGPCYSVLQITELALGRIIFLYIAASFLTLWEPCTPGKRTLADTRYTARVPV